MGSPGKNLTTIFLSIILFLNISYGQIIFKELPDYEIKLSDSLFFDISSTRSIVPLNGRWQVHPSNDPDKKVYINIPSAFEGKGELIFERSFSLTEEQINTHNLYLHFLGLNYTADISVNNIIIYRHSGGEFPFKLPLPRDILHKNKSNILSVKLSYELDSENTIPVKQRFFFPSNFGGILRDVYIHLIPGISVSDINVSRNYSSGTGKTSIGLNARIENHEFRRANDTIPPDYNFTLRTIITSPGGISSGSASYNFELPFNKEQNVNQQVEINSPVLWSPSAPVSYTVRIELWRGDRLIDVSRNSLAVYSLIDTRDSLLFNGSSFSLHGVTYVPSFYGYGNLAGYDQMEKDIRIIKETGFNSIRFFKTIPHPYYLYLCEKYGLLSLIEIPLSSVPADLSANPNFVTRSRNYLTSIIKAYKKYSSVAAIGVGNSFLPQIEEHRKYVHDLASIIKNSTNALTYASFADINIPAIENLDLYGVEFINESIIEKDDEFKLLQNQLGAGKVFVSSATYVVNRGNSDGYVNAGSYEAQAKYFEELLEYSDTKPVAGYFISSMFDYRGDYNSLISGYSIEKIYNIGISGENRSTSRLAYKVISAKLHNQEKVTIPIGSKKDDAPMMYIVFGLVLALFMGVLVNSGRKFREDTSRALLRPYNFFADVRDQRIMSGPHTTMLMLVIAAVAALMISNLLSYLKENIFFERILLSFGSKSILQVFSFLSWNPLFSLIWLTVGFIAFLIALTAAIKIASFFVRTKVYLSSVYFSVIWSFLPMVLLIPVGIILYRLLNAGAGNIYIYIGLVIMAIWIFYRLMKGIYVIFDVTAGSVYFYSILLVLFFAGGTLFYYEIHNSVIDYLQLTIKQFYPGGS
ncbi:MAG: glycoside hydrolase family 2 TIM barrel-domain containing protein [Ignavibacteriaceae bacterium]